MSDTSQARELTRQWLKQVAQPYENKDRVYTDVDALLATWPTLRPKTDVYTYNDGRTQLLLCIHGLIPITFRQASYNIPVAIWLTLQYPRDAPMVYVVPTSDMLVKASKQVEHSGRCQIDYLHHWERKSEGCDLANLTRSLQGVFSREPPLYAKPRVAPSERSAPSSPAPHSRPAVPPKPYSTPPPSPQVFHAPVERPSLIARPPPPLPPNLPQTGRLGQPAQPPIAPSATSSPSFSNSVAHPNAAAFNSPLGRSQAGMPSNVPVPPGAPSLRFSASIPNGSPPPHAINSPPSYVHAMPAAMVAGQVHYVNPAGYPPGFAPTPVTVAPPPLAAPQVSVAPPPLPAPHAALTLKASSGPAPNLLDEEAFETIQAPLNAAPPRPPNPEFVRLQSSVYTKVSSELSALSSSLAVDSSRLQVTQADLLAGEPAIHDEMHRLVAVRDVCRAVATRLADCVQKAEANVRELKRKGDPEVDELVCSTTIVHNQLINLVAEDKAIEDTMYHLHRALNAGRLDLERFLRTTRALAQEQFIKRALIQKITAGLPMGISMGWS